MNSFMWSDNKSSLYLHLPKCLLYNGVWIKAKSFGVYGYFIWQWRQRSKCTGTLCKSMLILACRPFAATSAPQFSCRLRSGAYKKMRHAILLVKHNLYNKHNCNAALCIHCCFYHSLPWFYLMLVYMCNTCAHNTIVLWAHVLL